MKNKLFENIGGNKFKMSFNENTEMGLPFRYILFGTGSGNVYGVSNTQDIDVAIKDVLKDLTLGYSSEHSETPEYDDASTMDKSIKKHDGYAEIIIKDSDEGSFGLVDVQSTNPDVQAEIEDLDLIKYAKEYLADGM